MCRLCDTECQGGWQCCNAQLDRGRRETGSGCRERVCRVIGGGGVDLNRVVSSSRNWRESSRLAKVNRGAT
jgi:hypothetical protein